MFKVGDRVNVYADEIFKATITEIKAAICNEKLLHIKSDKSDADPVYYAKQCRKLVKKRKFKYGDEVRFKLGMDYKKGYVNSCISNDMVKVINYPNENSFEHEMYDVHINKLELVKEKSQFNINDRVIIKHDNGLGWLIGKKGTITYLTPDRKFAEILTDDFHLSLKLTHGYTLNTANLKKLVKKKTEFKVGDRVVFKENGIVIIKGNIEEIIKGDDGFTISANIGNMVLINVKYLKKLVKKKKISFKEPKQLIWELTEKIINNKITDEELDKEIYKLRNKKKSEQQPFSEEKKELNDLAEKIIFNTIRDDDLEKEIMRLSAFKSGRIFAKELQEEIDNHTFVNFMNMAAQFEQSKYKFNGEPKLLPCPFCGCEDCYFTVINAVLIKCPKCGMQSKECCNDNKETLIKNWNRRSYP